MSEDGEKPSYEAQQDLAILGITFTLANEVTDSIKESKKKTEIWTLSERLKSVAEMSPIPKLTRSNWRHWQESDPPNNGAIKMWSKWWSSKLRETAPHIKTAPSDSTRNILKEITISSQADSHTSVLHATARFWNYKPAANVTPNAYLKEFQKRLHELREHTTVSFDVKVQSKNLLLYHFSTKRPDLVARCKSFSLEQTISECLTGTSGDKTPSKQYTSDIKCNFCQNVGHSINECRKKKRTEKEQNKNNNVSRILSVNNPSDSSYYQLDTAADSHVS
ncbi:hypothetical protein EPUL_005979, partial [Erysiphe pulchra]